MVDWDDEFCKARQSAHARPSHEGRDASTRAPQTVARIDIDTCVVIVLMLVVI